MRASSFDPITLRRTVLEMAFHGQAVHIGCAFSIIELLAVLYRSHLRYTVDKPRDPARDYLVFSKGHDNPPDRPKAPEVEFFTKEFLHEEVKIYR